MRSPVQILLLEENLKDAELLTATLGASGLSCVITRVDTESEFRKQLDAGPDLIVGDYTLPSFDGKKALAMARQYRPEIPFIFVSATLGEEAAVDSLIAGATDYVLKHKFGRLVPAVRRALHEAEDQQARAEAEQALRQSEAKYRRLFEESRDAIFIASLDGNLVDINPAGLKIFDYESKDDFLQMNIGRDLYWDSGHWNEIREQLEDKGYVEDIEVELKRRDGSKVIALETTSVSYEQGDTKTFHGTWRDVTHQRELETQFLRAQRMESVGSLAGGIAHDLNNVLSPIVFGVELLRETHNDPASLHTLDTLAICARRGANLLKQILMFARGVEGRRITVHVGSLLRNMENMLKQTLPKSIQIVIDNSPELWTVSGDPTQLEQVLMNLCVNARDAMPNGGVLTIAVHNEVRSARQRRPDRVRMGRHVVIQVKDTGNGISAEDIDRIFDPFFTTKKTGTGLGLSTVDAIVKNHGGFVRVDSGLGRGATFKVYLPALEGGVQDDKDSRRSANEFPQGSGELVLFVDDEPGVRDLARIILEKHGYRVLTAADGVEGLAVYSQHRNDISVVLTDLDMPKMGGPELIRTLERMNPAVHVISASGLAFADTYGQVVAGPVRAVLQKPFSPADLLKTLHEVLHGQ